MGRMKAGRPSKKSAKQAVSDFTSEKFKINAEIPTKLYKKAKIYAIEESTTLTEVIRKSLEEYLSKKISA